MAKRSRASKPPQFNPYETTIDALVNRRAEAYTSAAELAIRAIKNGQDDPEAFRAAIRAIAQLDEIEHAISLAEASGHAPQPIKRPRRRAR